METMTENLEAMAEPIQVPPLTEQQLRIPRAIANRYWESARRAHLDFDDVIQVGSLELVAAHSRFVPEESPGGLEGLDGWLVHAVEHKIRNYIWAPEASKEYRRRICDVQDPLIELDGDRVNLLSLIGDGSDHVIDYDNREECRTLLRMILPIRDAAVLQMHWLDTPIMTYAQIGERLGIHKERVRQIACRALQKLRRSLATRHGLRETEWHGSPEVLERWRGEDPERAVAQQRQSLQMAHEQLEVWRETRRNLGVVNPTMYYLADYTRRAAWGGWYTLGGALETIGLTPERFRGGPQSWRATALGWPGLTQRLAVTLDALCRGGRQTVVQLSDATGIRIRVLQDVVTLLRRRKLATVIGRSGRGHTCVYEALSLAGESRQQQTDLVPLRGRALLKLQADGWKVLPQRMVHERKVD